MANAWSGPDPTQSTDSASYSLGLTGKANVDVSVIGLRVWEGASPGTLVGRNGRLWSSTGSQLAVVSMPTTLPGGWSEYDFASPVTVRAGTVVTIAYDTGGFYGQENGAFNSDVTSADGAITLLGASNPSAPHGNGSFTTSVGAYPDHASPQNTFYGVDFVYSVIGTDIPTVTGVVLSIADAVVTATVQATDPAGLAGASYRIDWGDGTTPTTGSSATAQHTYATSGIYSIVVTVTNASGNTSLPAGRPVQVQVRGFVPGLSTLLEQLAQYLANAGLGAYAPNDVTGTIFLSALPETPDQAIAVARYGGPEADAKLGYDTPSIQVRVRGLLTDAADAERTAQRVYDVLHGLANTALPGGIWLVSCIGSQSGPTYIGRDMSGRHEFTVNFRTEVRNTAGGRE